MELTDRLITIITDIISIGTPMTILAYNAGKMRQQLSTMKEDVNEVKELFFQHIKIKH